MSKTCRKGQNVGTSVLARKMTQVLKINMGLRVGKVWQWIAKTLALHLAGKITYSG